MSGRRARRLRVIASALNPAHPRLAHRRLKKLWSRRGRLTPIGIFLDVQAIARRTPTPGQATGITPSETQP